MFEIRYSGAEEIELAAARVELEAVRTAVLGLITSNLSELWFEADQTINPMGIGRERFEYTTWWRGGPSLDI